MAELVMALCRTDKLLGYEIQIQVFCEIISLIWFHATSMVRLYLIMIKSKKKTRPVKLIITIYLSFIFLYFFFLTKYAIFPPINIHYTAVFIPSQRCKAKCTLKFELENCSIQQQRFYWNVLKSKMKSPNTYIW